MSEMCFWSGTRMLKKEKEVISQYLQRRNIDVLYTACFRLSNDISIECQIGDILDRMAKVGYNKDYLDVIFFNAVISEEEYPIEKCCPIVMVDFSRHPNE